VSGFLTELKRRRVFKVAAVYAVVAWLLIQVSATILPTFGAPEWVNKSFIFLLVIGFPVALILSWAYDITPEGIKSDTGTPTTPIASPSNDRKLIYAILGLVLVVAGFQISDRFLVSSALKPSTTALPQSSAVMRLSLPISVEEELFLGGRDARFGRPAATSLALTNDGRQLIYSAWKPGTRGQQSQLYSRPLEQERAQPISGTEGGTSPFLSPDNEWIGFFAEDSIRRVPLNGGISQAVITKAKSFRFEIYGATWGDDNSIVYADEVPSSAVTAIIGLYRVPSSGGSSKLVANPLDSNGQILNYTQPHFLPGGHAILFQGFTDGTDPEQAKVFAMDLNTGARTTIISNAMNPRYSLETGQLLFMRQGQLMSVGFDLSNLTLRGDAAIVAENVMQSLNMGNYHWNTGVGQLAISSAGHLVYARGGVTPNIYKKLVRVTNEGQTAPIDTSSLKFQPTFMLRLAPDGNRLAYISDTADGANLHVLDRARNVSLDLNTGGFRNMQPIWSPDGLYIAFRSNREDGVENIYRIRADGSDERPKRLVPSNKNQQMQSWSSQGHIAYLENNDIWISPPDGEPTPYFSSNARENYATFSPNGRWLAYVTLSELSDSGALYIRPFPGPGRATLIASSSILSPAWSHDGKQLYYLSVYAASDIQKTYNSRMMVVDIDNGTPSPARSLVDPWLHGGTTDFRSYEVLDDGSFIATSGVKTDEGEISEVGFRRDELAVKELQVVLNFYELLRNRVAR